MLYGQYVNTHLHFDIAASLEKQYRVNEIDVHDFKACLVSLGYDMHTINQSASFIDFQREWDRKGQEEMKPGDKVIFMRPEGNRFGELHSKIGDGAIVKLQTDGIYVTAKLTNLRLAEKFEIIAAEKDKEQNDALARSIDHAALDKLTALIDDPAKRAGAVARQPEADAGDFEIRPAEFQTITHVEFEGETLELKPVPPLVERGME